MIKSQPILDRKYSLLFLVILDNRVPKETFNDGKNRRTARNMKHAVFQTMNEIYSNLLLDPEENQKVNLRIIGSKEDTTSADVRKLVHYHDRYAAENN